MGEGAEHDDFNGAHLLSPLPELVDHILGRSGHRTLGDDDGVGVLGAVALHHPFMPAEFFLKVGKDFSGHHLCLSKAHRLLKFHLGDLIGRSQIIDDHRIRRVEIGVFGDVFL